MNSKFPHIIALKGFSSSGKTTSLEALIKFLTDKGEKVSIIKHIHQDNFSIDQTGKDTWKMRIAGGEPIVSYSNNEIAFLTNHIIDLPTTIQILTTIRSDLHYIFLEGFWENKYPKILFFRTLEDFESLLNEMLTNSLGNTYLTSVFCMSGTYFASSEYTRKSFVKKINDLSDSGIIPRKLKEHFVALPIINIKDNPEKLIKIYQNSC
jgi:molybdopterin-guanine dinucleotide biosynthesis protein MobB